MMKKLTDGQRTALQNLQTSTIFVGNYSPDVKRSYDALVRRGLATVVEETTDGARYALKFRG